MASWRPAIRETDPLRAALLDYLRARAARVFLEASAGVQPLGRATVVSSDGQPLVIDLTIAPERAATVANRAALLFAVAGHAANREAGYQVQGRIVLDRKTLAFLSIEVSVEFLGPPSSQY